MVWKEEKIKCLLETEPQNNKEQGTQRRSRESTKFTDFGYLNNLPGFGHWPNTSACRLSRTLVSSTGHAQFTFYNPLTRPGQELCRRLHVNLGSFGKHGSLSTTIVSNTCSATAEEHSNPPADRRAWFPRSLREHRSQFQKKHKSAIASAARQGLLHIQVCNTLSLDFPVGTWSRDRAHPCGLWWLAVYSHSDLRSRW